MTKNVIKKDIKHENYKDVLFINKQVYHRMRTIRSQRHQLGCYGINKISLAQLFRRQTLTTQQWNLQLRLWSLRNIIYFTSWFRFEGE